MVKPLSTSLYGRQHCAEMKQQTREKVERNAETELDGVEEERDEMSGEKEMRLMAKRSWQRQIGE